MAWPKGTSQGAQPGEHRGRAAGTPNKPKSLRLMAQECEVEPYSPLMAREFDGLEAMKALAKMLMTKVTGKEPATDYQRVLYEQRMTHLVPLLKEITTYQRHRKAPEPATATDDRYELLKLLVDLVRKHVPSEGQREIYDVIEGELQKDLPRLVTPSRTERSAGV